MRSRVEWFIGVALVGMVACSGDGGSGPSPGGNEGARLAARFDQLADSVAGVGLSPTADALHHAAEIVRLTGHATPVTLTIDGVDRQFQAVAEQLDFPQVQCWWPVDSTGATPGDSGTVEPGSGGGTDSSGAGSTGSSGPPSSDPVATCTDIGTYSMRTLIAWEPEHMAEVVRLVADLGSNQVDSTVPDVMAGLPTSPARGSPPAASPGAGPGPGPDPVPPDTAVGGGGSGGGSTGGSPGYPGFMGEYLVGDQGIWFAVEGSQSNELIRSGDACTADQATIDWAQFSCEGARFAYQFSMRVEPIVSVGAPPPVSGGGTGGGTPLMGSDPGTAGADGEHSIAMARTEVDGVRLTVVAWTPPPVPEPPPPGPPVPPPQPLPPDSVVTNH